MNIIIDNTEARLIELPCVAPKVATGKEVVKEAVLDRDGVMVSPTEYMELGALIEEGYDLQQLKPGQNDIDAAYWDRICTNKGVKILIAAGYLVNMGEGKAVTLVSDLDTVDVGTAKQMILECNTMSALTAWGETENLGLKKLIAERKAELIDKADGRPVRGPKVSAVDLGTFGDGVSHTAADGTGESAHGIGEQG